MNIHPFSFLFILVFVFSGSQEMPIKEKMKLSDYGFFEGELSDLSPTDEVHPYSLKTALFTDYAEKLRFVVLPKGAKINYNATEVLDFPEGTTLIKTFYYPNDFTKPKKGRRLLETRLLIRNEKGWRALPYVWNEDQTEAYLEVAGETFEVKYVDINGKKKKHLYGVPNLNQCKGCHNRDEVLMPIGPSARQLNSELDIPAYLSSNALKTYQKGNQLDMLIDKGILDHVPENHAFPEIANWQDNDAPLDARARAWLDINCAHCHRPDGPANTSGLNLSIHNTDATSLGILKAPVATGRASGDLVADITPGKADESILVRRLAATDPGVMMPELGRKTVHQESLQLIKDWINQMD